jgi:hypothetical protein
MTSCDMFEVLSIFCLKKKMILLCCSCLIDLLSGTIALVVMLRICIRCYKKKYDGNMSYFSIRRILNEPDLAICGVFFYLWGPLT